MDIQSHVSDIHALPSDAQAARAISSRVASRLEMLSLQTSTLPAKPPHSRLRPGAPVPGGPLSSTPDGMRALRRAYRLASRRQATTCHACARQHSNPRTRDTGLCTSTPSNVAACERVRASSSSSLAASTPATSRKVTRGACVLLLPFFFDLQCHPRVRQDCRRAHCSAGRARGTQRQAHRRGRTCRSAL